MTHILVSDSKNLRDGDKGTVSYVRTRVRGHPNIIINKYGKKDTLTKSNNKTLTKHDFD